MKKPILYILLFVITIPLPGAYLALLVKKHFIKLEVILELGKKDKSLLSFIHISKQEAETELEWKHPWEFKYKDYKYDVLEKSESSDSILLVCRKDVEETKVDQQLALLVNSNPQQKENNKKIEDYLSKLFIPANLFQIDFNNHESISFETKLCKSYSNPSLLSDFPPPKM